MTNTDSHSAFLPPQIQNRQFTVVRRGYDRAEVSEFLNQISTMMAELLKEQAAILATQDDGADRLKTGSEASDPDGSDQVSSEQMAAVEDIEARAARRLNAASLEADRLRSEARRVLEVANAEVRELEATAKAKAEQLTTEAQQTRQKIMADLMRRRKEAQAHVEMLRAARDELLASFAQVQRITAQAAEPLDGVLERAKSAADNAVKQLREQQHDTAEQLEVADVHEVVEHIDEGKQDAGRKAKGQDVGRKAKGQDADRKAKRAAVVEEAPQSTEAEVPQPHEEAELEAKLSSIFARLHEGESTEPQPESQPPEPQPPEPQPTPQPPEPQPAEQQTISPPSSVSQTETELVRQLKRAHTEDESRVLQAIQKFHGKPRKQKALTNEIMNSELRLDSYKTVLDDETSKEVLTRVLLVPLAEELSSCPLLLSDSKSLIQQVRDIYRQFSEKTISVVADELASGKAKG